MPIETMPWKELQSLVKRLRYQCRSVAPLVAEIEHHVQRLPQDVEEVEVPEDDVVARVAEAQEEDNV